MEADKNHPVEIDEDEDEEPRQFRMGFKQLDILASLYIKTEEFDKAIVSIKEGVRRLQNRSTSILIARGHLEPSVNALSASSQAIADLDSDDSDLDVPEQQIPLQLRVKLEISRLRLGQVSINTHFSSFLNSDCLEKISLCFDIVEAYIKNQLYSEALDILDFLNNNDQDSKLFIMQQTAFCNHQLGDYESAIEQYKELIQLDPTNLNIKLKLAESYQECGMEDESSLLIDEIDLASKQASKKVKVKRVRKVDEYIEESEDDDDDSDDQHVILGLGKKKQDSMLTSAAKSLLIKQVDESILKMKLLEPKIDDDRIALMDYIRTCRSLISTFINTRKPLSKANLEKSIERFTNGEFQGLNIKEWYMIFINQAKLLTRTDRQDDAHETLQEAFECKVFSFSTDRKVVLKLHQLASAFQVSNFTRIAEVLRWMFIARPRAAYRLYNIVYQGFVYLT